MKDTNKSFNPKLDLLLERVVDVPPRLVWQAWTRPEHLKHWFCPKPWRVTECEIDLKPGGLFRTVMKGPDGQGHESKGCYLEIIENRKLVWTDALEAGYRPTVPGGNGCVEGNFTAELMLTPHDEGTKYTVIARHGDEETRRAHNERGFQEGWGTALEQLVAYMKAL